MVRIMNTKSNIGVKALLFGAGLLATLASYSSAMGETKKIAAVGQILYGVDAYQQAHGRFFEEYAKELGIKVRTINGENSQSVQDKGARDLVNAGVDAIIIQPAEPLSATGTMQAIQGAKIPVLEWGNGQVPNIKAPYLALDEREQTFQAGVNAAKYMQEHKPGQALKMVILDVPALQICSEYRMGEFIKGVQSVDPTAKVTARVDGGGVRAQSKKVMEDVLNSGAEFNILTACNGESLLGALSAVTAAGRGQAQNKVPVSEYIFSIDGSPAEIQKLVDPNSSLMQVMMLTPYENSRKLLDVLIKYHDGEIKDDYRSGIGSLLIGPSCVEANELLQKEYSTKVKC
jgi:ABC-type sugar transport system substrate-binding protein